MNLKQKLAQIALDRMVAENERLGLYHNPEYVDSMYMSEKHVHESDKSIHEMINLRQAAEMALKYFEDAYGLEDEEVAIKDALRQALAQPDHIRDATKKVEPEWIDDGFGNMWQKCGKKNCGRFVVNIGKVDCYNDDCLQSELSGAKPNPLYEEKKHEG